MKLFLKVCLTISVVFCSLQIAALENSYTELPKLGKLLFYTNADAPPSFNRNLFGGSVVTIYDQSLRFEKLRLWDSIYGLPDPTPTTIITIFDTRRSFSEKLAAQLLDEDDDDFYEPYFVDYTSPVQSTPPQSPTSLFGGIFAGLFNLVSPSK